MKAVGQLRVRDGRARRIPRRAHAQRAGDHRGAGSVRRGRRALMRARIDRRARRQRDARADRLPAGRTRRSAARASRCSDARAGRFDGGVIPDDLQRQWIQGTGPAARPRASNGREHPQRRLRAAVGRRRLDVRRRGRARPGRQHVARQPAQPEAGVRAGRRVHDRRRAGRRRDECVGAGLLRPPDHPRTGGRSSTSRRASSARAACTSTIGTCAHADGRVALGVDRRPGAVRHATTRVLRGEGRSVVLYLPKIQTAEEAALWNDMLDALERHLGLPQRRRSRSMCSSSSSRRRSS